MRCFEQLQTGLPLPLLNPLSATRRCAPGELGLGGNSKNVCTPSRLPWAHDVTAVAASAGGRFAAVVDRGGRLLTFGAGALRSQGCFKGVVLCSYFVCRQVL